MASRQGTFYADNGYDFRGESTGQRVMAAHFQGRAQVLMRRDLNQVVLCVITGCRVQQILSHGSDCPGIGDAQTTVDLTISIINH